MIFLADEGVDRQIVERLRREEWEVLYVIEMERGISDDEVLDQANTHGALLITTDKGFGELVYRVGRITAGVVLIRLAGLQPETKAEIVANAVRSHANEMEDAFTAISPGMVRIRQKGDSFGNSR